MNVPDNILEPVNKKGFFSHVFSSTEECKAEILNVVQYSLMGVIPIVMLNKMIQRFIPDADPDKSSIELLAEVLIQIVVMFVGIVIIHRIITYIPTYSEFKYESLTLTNVILAFLILILSIQTKLGIKVNVLFDRVLELWNGPSIPSVKPNPRNPGIRHVPSQGDYLGSSQTDMFPPAPLSMSKPDGGYDYMVKGNAPTVAPMMEMGPMAANGVLGGSFGSSF